MDRSIAPARFRTHGLTIEVVPSVDEDGAWEARVIAPVSDWRWHRGRRAWEAVERAAESHDEGGGLTR